MRASVLKVFYREINNRTAANWISIVISGVKAELYPVDQEVPELTISNKRCAFPEVGGSPRCDDLWIAGEEHDCSDW
jgi:hypothetical protein